MADKHTSGINDFIGNRLRIVTMQLKMLGSQSVASRDDLIDRVAEHSRSVCECNLCRRRGCQYAELLIKLRDYFLD